MAFFKFRKSSGDVPAPEVPVQSLETIRQRAKYRLVGATVLILVGVIVLPLLFDKQPRPIAVDTPIDIPDKNKVLPLVIPPPPPAAAASAKAPVQASVGAAQSPAPAPSGLAETPAAVKSAASAPVAVAPVAKPAASAVAPKPVEVNRAQVLLEGKDASVSAVRKSASASAEAAGQRFVVQVGAFADDAHAREVRLKVERAGLKTYAQVADTKDGKRIRVRVGPFSSRADAEKAAAKIKKLDLPAALLTL